MTNGERLIIASMASCFGGVLCFAAFTVCILFRVEPVGMVFLPIPFFYIAGFVWAEKIVRWLED